MVGQAPARARRRAGDGSRPRSSIAVRLRLRLLTLADAHPRTPPCAAGAQQRRNQPLEDTGRRRCAMDEIARGLLDRWCPSQVAELARQPLRLIENLHYPKFPAVV